MDKTSKTILLALALGTSATGSAQAHDTYQLRDVDYYDAPSIDREGRVGVHTGTDSFLLEGSIIVAPLANAKLHDSDSSGQFVGRLNSGPAFFYDGITMQTLWNGWLDAISETGIAVGYDWSSGMTLPIEWDGSGVPVTLAVPPGWMYAKARAISDDDQFVVGHGQVSSTIKALLWDRDLGTVEVLDNTVDLVGGGTYVGAGSALGVNDGGDVVGSIGGAAVKWTWTTTNGWTTQHLGFLPGATTGCTARAVNDDGIVVGDCGTGEAFIWHPGDTQLTRLLTEVDPVSGSGWALELAHDINDTGQIVGFGTSPSGQGRGFVLSPESACLRPCTFSDGTTLQLPIAQCELLDGELPWGTTMCAHPGPGPVLGP